MTIVTWQQALAEAPAEAISEELMRRLQTVPYSVLQHMAAEAEIEMLNRTMPEVAYMED